MFLSQQFSFIWQEEQINTLFFKSQNKILNYIYESLSYLMVQL